jgi:solute carrier family 25 aspartate/glutamate transporter 12/13
MYFQGPSGLKRASTAKLREIFNKYATKEIKGEKYMTSEDFVRGFLGLFPDKNFNEVKMEIFHSFKLFYDRRNKKENQMAL